MGGALPARPARDAGAEVAAGGAHPERGADVVV